MKTNTLCVSIHLWPSISNWAFCWI